MNDPENVGVMYVGRKANATDNVGGSGKQWSFRGEVLLVTLAAAMKLCNFPDQWWPAPKGAEVPSQAEVDAVASRFGSGDRSALIPVEDAIVDDGESADEGDSASSDSEAAKPAAKAKPKAKKKPAAKKPVPVPKDVAKMDDAQLIAYAKKEHGHRLDPKLSLKKKRNVVDDLDRMRDEQG